jgi:hypothetical protein
MTHSASELFNPPVARVKRIVFANTGNKLPVRGSKMGTPRMKPSADVSHNQNGLSHRVHRDYMSDELATSL